MRSVQSPTNQEFHLILWKPRIPYYVHKNPQIFPFLCQIILLHLHLSSFFKIHINIILPSLLKPFTFPFLVFPSKSCVRFFLRPYVYLLTYRGADKSLARPDSKNNWNVAIFRPTRRSLLPRRPGWMDKHFWLFFFEWLAKVIVWSL